MDPTGNKTLDDIVEASVVVNYHQMLNFVGAIAGLGGLFGGFQLARRIGHSFSTGRNSNPLASISRKTRSVLLRKVPAFPSGGHALIIFLYLAINIILAFTNIHLDLLPQLPSLAARVGWLGVGNMCIVVFMSLKNTPLAFLTPWSYERLNIFHRVAGYTTIVCIIIHASSFAPYFISVYARVELTLTHIIMGQVAGVSLVILGISGSIIRRWCYELFYIIHVSFWILFIVMLGLHHPKWTEKIIYCVVVMSSLWAFDRLIRLTRLLMYSANNSATLTPLPNGGTRVTLKKTPIGAIAGQHCFLWIPKIRAIESHPFTMSSTDPLEFVVSAHDGFTKALHKYAVVNPGVTLTASVEGAYGTIPNPAEFDTVVLMAGGSGASFTFGNVKSMLNKIPADAQKKIVFIWLIKSETQFVWFESNLRNLEKDSRVDLQLYVTRSSSSDEAPNMEAKSTSAAKSPRTDLEREAEITTAQTPSSSPSFKSEKAAAYVTHKESGARVYEEAIRREKPDVEGLIRAAVDATPAENRVLVLGCGPEGLMTRVRNTTASCIRTDGPGVELHCEQFGW